MVLIFASTAFAQQGYPSPNSTLGVSVGTPWLLGGRAEAWFADEASFEAGAGTLGAIGDGLGVDWAIRWRPDFVCIACDQRVQGSFGVGVGGLVTPDFTFDGPWAFAVGPDLVGTFVFWIDTKIGLQASGRAGVGAGWVGDDFSEVAAEPWLFLTVGMAF